MGIVELEDNKGEISIIAGEVSGVKGPASTFTNINMYNVNLKNHGDVTIKEPSSYNTGILILKGEVKINDSKVGSERDFILFENMEGDIRIESISEDAAFIVLSGEPINEPIVAYGPFVMNTEEEIRQAYNDMFSNKFGSEDF